MKIKDWEIEFDKEFPDGLMLEYDRKTDTWEIDITDEVKTFIKDLLSQSNQEIVKEILDRVYKEVIGEDERNFTMEERKEYSDFTIHLRVGANQLRQEQRQKLEKMEGLK